jgi:[acyl-carrier-protein] S-malonyltransferase
MSTVPAVAFIFPGQGSQRVGMGAGLRATDPGLYDCYLGRAEELSGLPLRRHLDGPMEVLTRTEVAQPALFALELALYELAGEHGVRPRCVGGHSVGEYAAAVAAGCLSPDDGIRLVVERSRRMAAVQEAQRGAMAAILGPSADSVAAWCALARDAGAVAVANLNTPTQTVASGSARAVDEVCAMARGTGARAVRLPVGGAFHTPYMRPVQAAVARAVTALAWRDAKVPMASNVSGAVISSAADVRAALVEQVTAPVRWVDCVRALVNAGCTTFLELGPGRVLANLVRAVDPTVEVHAADSRAALATFAATCDLQHAA